MVELPHLVKVAREFESEGGRVIGISQDLFVPGDRASALQQVDKTIAARGISFPVFVLDAKTMEPLNERYALPGPIPCTLAFDANGKEVDREEGDAGEERFRQMMRKALGK